MQTLNYLPTIFLKRYAVWEFSLENQVAVVTRNAFTQLKLVQQLKTHSDLATITHALVVSRLFYCSVLHVQLPAKTIEKRKLVQNAVARVVTGAKCYDSSGPLLRQLH